MKALKAALLLRTAEPGYWSSLPSNPLGKEILAAKVTVVISIATTKWASATFSGFPKYTSNIFFLCNIFLC